MHLKYSYGNFKKDKDDFLGGKAKQERKHIDKEVIVDDRDLSLKKQDRSFPEEEVLLTKSQLDRSNLYR